MKYLTILLILTACQVQGVEPEPQNPMPEGYSITYISSPSKWEIRMPGPPYGQVFLNGEWIKRVWCRDTINNCTVHTLYNGLDAVPGDSIWIDTDVTSWAPPYEIDWRGALEITNE